MFEFQKKIIFHHFEKTNFSIPFLLYIKTFKIKNKMNTHNFSIEDLAMSLIVRLDRRNIFPPLLNNPETFLSPTDNLTNLSFRRPKRSPNAFLVCRRNVHEEATRKGTFNMRIISKVTGILWKNAHQKKRKHTRNWQIEFTKLTIEELHQFIKK